MAGSAWGDAANSRAVGTLLFVVTSTLLAGASMAYFSNIAEDPPPHVPILRLADAPPSVVRSAPHDPLAVLAHRGGDALAWKDVEVVVLREGVPAAGRWAVAFAADPECRGSRPQPAGLFGVGESIHVCAVSDGWARGDHVTVCLMAVVSRAVLHESRAVVQ